MAHVRKEAQLDLVAFLGLRAGGFEFLGVDVPREVFASQEKQGALMTLDRLSQRESSEVDEGEMEHQATEGIPVEGR